MTSFCTSDAPPYGVGTTRQVARHACLSKTVAHGLLAPSRRVKAAGFNGQLLNPLLNFRAFEFKMDDSGPGSAPFAALARAQFGKFCSEQIDSSSANLDL